MFKRWPKAVADLAAPGPDPVAVPRCVVGIGAGAGGVDAIRNFFREAPVDSGAAFVVIQASTPAYACAAADLLSRLTAMPVTEVTNGTMLEANHVYTAPSGKVVAVLDGRFCMTAARDAGHVRLPVDHFFKTLGQNSGPRAIGIVLSGNGSDGSEGAKAISMHGGVVLVQTPETAECDGMLRSAIATGVANCVLPVEKMPSTIARYARHPYAATNGKPHEPCLPAGDIQDVIRIVSAKRGYDFGGYKRGGLRLRIERRMGLHGALHHADYARLLKTDARELDALFKDLLTGVTEYFRDRDAWRMLESQVVAPLVAGKQPDEPIRIWVPGCSTGEEAYTMAMVLLEFFRHTRKHCPVQIFATDSNNDVLEIGRDGHYPIGIAARISPVLLSRYFSAGPGREYFAVKQELRKCVVFGVQDLFADPPFGGVDLISCRDVLSNLEPAAQKRVLDRFHFALRPQGYLFLGSADSNGARDDIFRPLSKGSRIFQRKGSSRNDVVHGPCSVGNAPNTPAATQPPRGLARVEAARFAQRLILDRFSPACVVVNAHHEAVYFCGPTGEFLTRPQGAPSPNLWFHDTNAVSVPRAKTEDLRASNGEIVCSNEELSSLEEEFKGPTGELAAVNQQLEAKVRALERVNSELTNLVACSDVATICLDEDLRIKWFAPAAQRQFNFLAGDLGRPIGDMLHAIGDVGLVVAARAVLARKIEPDREFQVENGRWYICRTLPYQDAAGKICGVIATYTDITDNQLAREAASATRNDLVQSRESAERLRLLSAALVTAEDRERRLLAQDLHDDLGQLLAIVSLKVAMIEKIALPDSTRRMVGECAQAVEQANRKLRTMALQLNPPMLEQLGLIPAIQWLADELHRLHNIEVDIEDDGLPKPMDRAVSATLFRAVRELLVNVSKHARVSKALVAVTRNADGTLTLTVSDAGAGFDPAVLVSTADRGGFGLISLRERLGYLGGWMEVRSVPGHGTSVIVNVPLMAPDDTKSMSLGQGTQGSRL